MGNCFLTFKIKAVLERRDQNGAAMYDGARITDKGTRTLAEQVKFVKERPKQYPATLNRFFSDFKIDPRKVDDTEFMRTIYDNHQKWLEDTIQDLAKKRIGFKHLSGHAVDISVRQLDNLSKMRLFNELVDQGVYILLEKVDGAKSVYGVTIDRANVFHVEEKGSRTQSKYPILPSKRKLVRTFGGYDI